MIWISRETESANLMFYNGRKTSFCCQRPRFHIENGWDLNLNQGPILFEEKKYDNLMKDVKKKKTEIKENLHNVNGITEYLE